MLCFFFFKQKTAYEIRKGDWSSDVCSSDLGLKRGGPRGVRVRFRRDIEAALAGAANDLEEERCVSLAHARHVDHMQRGTRRRRVGDHLLQPRHAAPGSRVPPALA